MTESKKKIDFIGIGAPKSGSTWVGQCLEDHPDILMSSQKSRKEVFFFNTPKVWGNIEGSGLSFYDRGLDWYLDQFPKPQEGKIRGEFSVSYMADPVAYERIHEAFPDVKIIALLRNPVDMIYSLYRYFYNGAIVKMPDNFIDILDNQTFVEKGFYYKHMKKYFDTFPAENIHIIFFDDINKKPKQVLSDLYEFLGVNAEFIPENYDKRINSAFTPRSKLIKDLAYLTMKTITTLKLERLRVAIIESRWLWKIYSFFNQIPSKNPQMSDEDRKKCIEIYKDDIKKLSEFLNRDLSHWTKL